MKQILILQAKNRERNVKYIPLLEIISNIIINQVDEEKQHWFKVFGLFSIKKMTKDLPNSLKFAK